MRQISSFGAALLLCGCTTNMIDGDVHRGRLAFVGDKSTQSNYEKLSHQRVKGKACFDLAKGAVGADDAAVYRAFANTIASYEGATALLDAEIEDKGACIHVTGIPARLIEKSP